MGGKWRSRSELRHYVYAVPYAANHERFAGMPCYIGAGSGRRLEAHLQKARSRNYTKSIIFYDYLWQAFETGANLTPYIIKDRLTRDEANTLESELIAAHGRADLGTGCLLNCTDGGGGAPNPSHASLGSRAAALTGRLSKLKGRTLAPEQVEKSASWHRGRKRSAQVRANLSASLSGKPKTGDHKAKIAVALTGHVRSDESKAKQSAAMKGRPKSPETRERMRAAALLREAQKRAAIALSD